MDIGLHSVKCGIAAAHIDELVVCSGRGRRRRERRGDRIVVALRRAPFLRQV